MSMLSKFMKQKDNALDNLEVTENSPTPAQVKSEFVNTMSKAVDSTPEDTLESPATNEKMFKVKFSGKKFKVPANTEEEAVEKVKRLLGIEEVEIKQEAPKITIGDIFNAISEEIKRIVTVAHPETVTNNYDRWAAVITEELGEIVHEINDQHEGKRPTKNMYVECVQLAAATVLLAKKYAKEHPEMFIQEE